MTVQSRRLRVLSFTTVFPSRQRPVFGLFVWERLRHAAAFSDLWIVAPVAWQFRGPLQDTERGDVPITHPRFYYIPGLFKVLDGFWLALSAVASVRRIRRHFDFDLVDAHFGYPDGVAAACLALLFGRPLVVTLRGSEVVTARYVLRRWLMSWALRRAAVVMAVSRPLADLARSLGVEPGRVTVIENGVDLERFWPTDRKAVREELGRDPRRRLLVSVGHLVPLKGFHRVIAALPAVLKQHDTDYVVVGGVAPRGEQYRDALQDLVGRLGLEGRVHFTGALPPEGVRRWLQGADVLVLDSDREGCPNVVLEALACGTPVVAAAVGAVPDMVVPGAGLVYQRGEGADTLSDALQDALGRRWDPDAVRATVAGRSWASVGEATADAWYGATVAPHQHVRDTPGDVPR